MLPVLSMTMHGGIVKQSERFKKTIASKDVSAYKVVYPGQLVVGFPIDEGVIYVQSFDEPGIMSPAYNVWDIDTNAVLPGYLELALHGPSCMAYYADKMRGTTARRRTLTSGSLAAMSVPLPSMDRQWHIVSILRVVRSQFIACGRRLSLLDDLVKSRFVEMFGDPEDFNGKWGKRRLDGFTTIVTGNTPSRKNPVYYGGYLEWVKTDNIVDGSVTQAVEWLSEEGATKARIAPRGAVLMACIAGSVRNIGKVALLDRSVAFNQQINAVIPSKNIESRFLLTMLSLSKDYLCSDVNMQLKGILNKSSLSAKEFPLPPLSLQREFSAFADRVAKSQVVVLRPVRELMSLSEILRVATAASCITGGVGLRCLFRGGCP